MPPAQHAAASFVLRVQGDGGAGRAQPWSGEVTHVPSGDRRALRSLADVVLFVDARLVSAGLARAFADGPVVHAATESAPTP